ncbi:MULTISPECIES: ECF-type sigma factor [Derxia]|uniref:ECF-type sigma factor n=1 Tax=Derxia gummosa DSM 723 TaxID=1121388 RepID=A0A8B6X3Y6_9BURK|nr:MULTISPECIES: ECF-type sigma factor [Derxia]
MSEVTELIGRLRGGDRAAFDGLYALLYPELRRVAHRRLARNGHDGGMQTTALVHECYLRFQGAGQVAPADRSHFLAYAASVMRSVVVDAARTAASQRQGGEVEHLPIDTELAGRLTDPGAAEVLELHAALADLARLDARLAQVVELRYFGGLTDAEIGEVLGLSVRTVARDWDKARLLLAHALRA